MKGINALKKTWLSSVTLTKFAKCRIIKGVYILFQKTIAICIGVIIPYRDGDIFFCFLR